MKNEEDTSVAVQETVSTAETLCHAGAK